MATRTKTERNAINAVRDFIDGTSCLRSFLQENDKTPLWDGSVFVYSGVPDKNETLVGTIKTQVKGTEINAFQATEEYRLTETELNLYMLEGGQFFFVVELLKDNVRERKIFYKKLTPHYIKALLKQSKGQKTIAIKLLPLPSDDRLFEDEMLNFLTDARKQTSYVRKNDLSLSEALQGPYMLKAEGYFNGKAQPSLALLVTSQPFTLYQETPHASIPVSDVELIGRATEHYHEPVSIGGKIYFQEHSRIYDLKTITDNIGNCLFFTSPKPGLSDNLQTQVEIKYPRSGSIADAINVAEFLMAVKEHNSVTFGDKEYPLQFRDEDLESLFKDVQYTYDLYCDIDGLWQSMQIPGTFSFDDFDETGLQQYLNVVLHVQRKEPGIPAYTMEGEKSFFSLLPAGRLHLLIHFTHLRDELFDSKDAFSVSGIISEGKHYPLLSLVLVKDPRVLPDNIHYTEQVEYYKKCLHEDPSFKDIVHHDLIELKKRLPNVESKEKYKKVEELIKSLECLYNQF